ncbi:hypothetical protein ACFL9T_08055 [Thermodesulfobacteriota bacterium]
MNPFFSELISTVRFDEHYSHTNGSRGKENPQEESIDDHNPDVAESSNSLRSGQLSPGQNNFYERRQKKDTRKKGHSDRDLVIQKEFFYWIGRHS